MPSISVRGEAILEADPEIAVVQVAIMARDKDRHRALGLLAKRSQQALASIKSHAEAVEKLESGPAHVYPELKEKRAGERVSGYVARAGMSVTVADFTVLGELMTDLAEQEMVTVMGPVWQMRPDSPVYRDARLAAARDAMRRAREYAEAFGGEITGLVEAADQGMLTPERHAAVRFHAMAAAGAAPELEFEPAKQTVHAQVEARFTMTQPG